MAEMRLVTPNDLPAPGGHYSHAVVAGGLAFISGLLPVDPSGNALANEPFEVQVAQVFHNLDEIPTNCGSSRSQVAQVRVYLTDVGLWGQFNALYAHWMGDHRPARCIVPVPALHFGVALELEAVAQAVRSLSLEGVSVTTPMAPRRCVGPAPILILLRTPCCGMGASGRYVHQVHLALTHGPTR